MRRFLLILIVLPFFNPVDVSAQARFGVTPRVGWFAPLEEFGPAAPVNEAWFLELGRVESALSLGISADFAWPGDRLSTRVLGMITLPTEAEGFFNCYPGMACPSILLETEADVTVVTALVDLVYSPLTGKVRPYAALGAGMKRYDFSWPSEPVFIDGGSYAMSAFALHGAVGVDLAVFGTSIRAELADYYSAGRIVPPEGTTAPRAPRRERQHDLGFSLGWRLLSF
jgi:hypothetical protein